LIVWLDGAAETEKPAAVAARTTAAVLKTQRSPSRTRVILLLELDTVLRVSRRII
jgi:hypothetical protein